MKQILKDDHGRTIGTVETVGSKQVIRDDHGKMLGTFDGKYTKDSRGRTIGQGNLLTTLLENK